MVIEVARQLIPPYLFLRSLLRIVSIIAALAVPIVLVMVVLIGGHETLFESIILLERAARFLQVCMLISVLAFVPRLGLTCLHYPVGIAAGFGAYSALDLALLEFRAHLHFFSDSVFVLLRPAAYNLAVFIWACYFLLPWRRKPIDRLPAVDLESWNNAVTGYVGQWYRRYWS